MRKAFVGIIMAACSLAAWADVPASFPGGQEALFKYLGTNVIYPVSAQENGIEGTVTVIFTVKPDGKISDIKIARPLDPDLEAEAIRVVKDMPAWTPATGDDGTPVSSSVTLPVKFRLTSR